jgi:apolipoprotein N-acyltransferase
MLNIKKIFYKKYILLFFSGLISSLAFAPFYLFFILFFSFYFLLKNIEKANNKKESFIIGWWFGIGYFIGGTYWMCISLLVDPLRFAWLIPFALTLIPAFLALYIGLTTLFTNILNARAKIKNKFIIITIFASFWILFEYLRAILFSGFPWNLIANVWCFSDIMIQIISLIGIYGFGFITIIFFSFFYLISEKILKKKRVLKYSALHICIFLTIFLFGFFRLKNAQLKFISNSKIRIAQPSIKQDLKWDKAKLQENIWEQILLSTSEGFDKIDYIIWSESAIPKVIMNKNPFLQELNDALKNKPLITGGLRAEFNKYGKIHKIYNTIFILKNGQVLDFYDKTHLVPFGEYIPFRRLFPFVSKITEGDLDFSEGIGIRTLKLNKFISFSPLICYEIIFSEKSIDYKYKPDFILNLTNDAWFGNSVGPYQHFDNARLRAVETGISVVRVANNGISGVIDGYGRVYKKLELNEKNFLDSLIPEKINIILNKKNKIILYILLLYVVVFYITFAI